MNVMNGDAEAAAVIARACAAAGADLRARSNSGLTPLSKALQVRPVEEVGQLLEIWSTDAVLEDLHTAAMPDSTRQLLPDFIARRAPLTTALGIGVGAPPCPRRALPWPWPWPWPWPCRAVPCRAEKRVCGKMSRPSSQRPIGLGLGWREICRYYVLVAMASPYSNNNGAQPWEFKIFCAWRSNGAPPPACRNKGVPPSAVVFTHSLQKHMSER